MNILKNILRIGCWAGWVSLSCRPAIALQNHEAPRPMEEGLGQWVNRQLTPAKHLHQHRRDLFPGEAEGANFRDSHRDGLPV